MAKTTASLDLSVTPQQAWERASDLSRYDQWLTIHDGWRGELPENIGEGTVMSSVVSVKGMRNRIEWTILTYDEPRKIVLTGAGVGGTKVSLTMSIGESKKGSSIELDAEFTGAMVAGPIGFAVSRALKGDIKKSLEQFSHLS